MTADPREGRPSGRPLPLADIRVIEFSHMVMGPTTGLLLADLGADVIKVEPAGAGDNTRRLTGSGAGFFATYNRNKRSIAIDLKSAEGKALADRLIAGADVLVENFRPGALDKLGFGEAAVTAKHPRLIYCSAKGFLPGPYQERTALDEVVQMMGGLAYMTGPPGRPLRAGASINDVLGGLFGALGVLAALIERGRTGRGESVTAGLFEACVFLVGQHMAQAQITGVPPQPMPNRQAAWAVYDVFDCADGEQLFLGVVTDTQWRAFCDAFDLGDLKDAPDLATNPARCAARDRFLPRLRTLLAGQTRDALIDRVAAIGLPYAPIVKPTDLFEDPHLAASNGLLPVTDPDRGTALSIPALPLEFGHERFGVRRDLPAAGGDTRAVLADLGLDDGEIDALLKAGTVTAPTG